MKYPSPRARDRLPRTRRLRPRLGTRLLARRPNPCPLLGRAVSLRPGSGFHFRVGDFRNLASKSIFLRRSNMKRTSLAFAVILLSLTCALGATAADSARVVKYAQTDIVPIRAKVR